MQDALKLLISAIYNIKNQQETKQFNI